MRKRLVFIAYCAILALCCPLIVGCQGADAVQTVVIRLLTPSPTPYAELIRVNYVPEAQTQNAGITPITPTPALKGDALFASQQRQETPNPTVLPTDLPTETPSPANEPDSAPEADEETPTPKPTASLTPKPTASLTPKPTAKPTASPTPKPTAKPTASPTPKPTEAPADEQIPTEAPEQPSQTLPSVSSGAYDAEDVLLAARVAYFEAGRTEEGYRAVLCVIVNRVEAGKWPDTVYDVVYQKSQFTVVKRDNFLTKTIPDDVISYADDVLNGGNRLLPDYVMSFRAGKDDKTWGDRTYYGTFGGNDFYY